MCHAVALALASPAVLNAQVTTAQYDNARTGTYLEVNGQPRRLDLDGGPGRPRVGGNLLQSSRPKPERFRQSGDLFPMPGSMSAFETHDLGLGQTTGLGQIGHRPLLSGSSFLDDVTEFVF